MMTLGSLFDGIGGFPLAAVHCGGVPVWASEIEPFPMRVTKLRFPDMIHVGDITKLDGAKLPPVDVICGGSPCQDLSVAGLRKGLAGERSGLFMDQVRIVKEMRAEDERRGVSDDFIRPRYLVWENVPGAFSSANGEDFRAVIEEIVHIKDSTCHVPRPDTGRWESAGAAILGDQFSLAWRVLDAQYWGVAQRRRRIFLVADFGGLTAPKILFEQERLPGDPAEGQDQVRQLHLLRLPGKGRQRASVPLIGADEEAPTGVTAFIAEKFPQAAALTALENGQLHSPVPIADSRDTGRPVRLVRLIAPGHQTPSEIAAAADGVRLVAVGDNQRIAHGADWVVDDEAGVSQLGGVMGLSADSILRGDEYAVAAVLAAAHDEIVRPVAPYHNAAPGIGGLLQKCQQVHITSPFP